MFTLIKDKDNSNVFTLNTPELNPIYLIYIHNEFSAIFAGVDYDETGVNIHFNATDNPLSDDESEGVLATVEDIVENYLKVQVLD
jgi:hypothetical protein